MVTALALVSGCSEAAPGGSGASPASSTAVAPVGNVKLAVVGTVVSGLEVPWGLGFLPDKSALVTERDSARVVRVVGGRASEVGKVEGVKTSSEGGLLGLAVDPGYPGRPYIYVYYSGQNDNRIARITYQDGKLSDQQVILDGIPAAAIHNGGRLRFGPDGYLYAGTGDGAERPNSQDDGSLGGKILRITTEGKAAPGNPGGRVWITKGHRNVQGLAFDGSQLYASEFGQSTWDELNVITPGADYGWPAAEGISHLDGMTDPIAQWKTADASPSGIAISKGYVVMAALRGQRLWVIPVANGKRIGEPRAFFTNQYGRLRTVEPAPDGSLWVTTSNTDGRGQPRTGDDRILRVTLSTS
ncbi:PQQ-dependent sugar dehydrogenase [Kribbella hippodromi]|uniref:PQQ-dependent sugar dehydrogenase n=1 Tax=Kribbella hippodromi TaxID=434347 RepID=UPI0031D3B2F7